MTIAPPKNVEDLSGRRFGKLTVLGYAGPRDGATWHCRCDCGQCVVRKSTDLRRGVTDRRGIAISCGCTEPRATHRRRQHPLYSVWQNMRNRCYLPTASRYAQYGGRGISVCPEWRESFEAFHAWAVAAGYEQGLQIDRIDPDGDYTPENCRFVTPTKNSRNRRVSRRLTWRGRTQTVREWAEELGVSYDAMQLRVTRRWSTERIFTQPFRGARR